MEKKNWKKNFVGGNFDFVKRTFTGRLLHTDSILKCCCRDCTGLIWTLNVALYAEFSRNVAWKILVWKYSMTATPRVPDWKWQSSTRQVWPKCLPMLFFQYFIRVTLNSQTDIFKKQKDEKFSKLDIVESLGRSTCSEGKKFWNLFWKSWSSPISDPVCAHS